MKLSILYCAECDRILAAAPGLGLAVECVAHDAHKGFVALRLIEAEVSQVELTDLALLASKYPKAAYEQQLEPPAGSCP